MPSSDQTVCLEAFYGISSPWAYLGANRAADIAARHGVPLVLRPIRVIQANGGIPLRSRPEARQRYHALELERWSRFLNIPLNPVPHFYPCRAIEPAAQAVIAVQHAGLDAKTFSFAVQRALWAENRDIADLETLRAIARGALGREGERLVCDPQPPSVVSAWEGNLEEARRLGIFGTPTYVVTGELFWGQDRLDFVDRKLTTLLTRAGEKEVLL